MSRRITRSLAKELPEEDMEYLTTVEQGSKKRAKGRSLTQEDIQKMKKFLVAFLIHRKRHNSPTNYDEWDTLRPVLKSGFEDALNDHQNWWNTSKSDHRNTAEKKWYEFCRSLIASGVTSWPIVMNGIKKAVQMIIYTYENPVENLLSEGHIRHNILKHMGLDEFKTLVNKDTLINFSNEEMLDFISQVNNPNSSINNQVHLWIRGTFRNYPWLIWFLNLRADIKAKDGTVTGVASINPNVINREYGTYLHSALLALYAQYSRWENSDLLDLIRHLIDSNADASINFNIDMAASRYNEESEDSSMHTPLSFAIWYASKSSKDDAWGIVKKMLAKRPLTDFYNPHVKSPHAFGMWRWKGNDMPEVIDNVWIVKHFTPSQIDWLLEHGGMDPLATTEDFAIALEDTKKMYEKTKADLDLNQQKLNRMKEEMKPLETMVTRLGKTILSYSTDFVKLTNKQEKINEIINKYKLHGGKRKNQRKKQSNKK